MIDDEKKTIEYEGIGNPEELYQKLDQVFKFIYKEGRLVTDANGVITQIEEDFYVKYGVEPNSLLGRSVYDLERQGVFKPSSVAKVLQTGEEVTILQTVNDKKRVIVTAMPIRDENGRIIRVVTYTRNMDDYIKLKQWYEALQEKEREYENKVAALVSKDIVTRNKKFEQVLDSVDKLAKYDINILLLGETGVGKTMIAKKIHLSSAYKNGRFIEINCGAIPEHLIESELFGYEKGAFTGADKSGKKGLVEEADKGTLFLDEITELPLHAQVKLLKIIQDKTIRRIGDTKEKKVDFRIIAATNKIPFDEIKKGTLREDLFYRLNTAEIKIPPLRERKEDIFLMSQYFLDKFNAKYSVEKILSPSVVDMLIHYHWPGNVRDLENVINRMVLTSEGNAITKDLLPEVILNYREMREVNEIVIEDIHDLKVALERFEQKIFAQAFLKYKSSVKVAKALNIGQTTAARKLKKYTNK